jgi:hypothetical protein
VATVAGTLPRPSLLWWLAAGAGAFLVAAAGWVVVACLSVWAELAGEGHVTGGAFRFATTFWLLAHGAPADIGGQRVTLIPLLLTLGLAYLLHGVAAYSARQAYLVHAWEAPDRTVTPDQRRSVTLRVAGVTLAVYTLVVAAVALGVGLVSPSLWAVAGALVVGAVAGGLGARQGSGWRPDLGWPVWARAIPRAAATSVTVLLLTGLAALATGVIVHRDLITALTEQLHPGVNGTILLTLLQGAYLPNLVVWAAVWTTGSGFALGGGSSVVLLGQSVDALPAFPIIGALPAHTVASWWNLCWLAGGVAAGAAAAWIVLRTRPRARFDETAVVGGLSGILGGVAFALLALVTRGGLGGQRLAGLGPLPLETFILAPTVLGFAGLVTGLVAGLLRAPAPEKVPAVAEQVARTVTLWSEGAAADGGFEEAAEPAAAAPPPAAAPARATPLAPAPVRPATPRATPTPRLKPVTPAAPPAPPAVTPTAAASPSEPGVTVHFGPHNVTEPVVPLEEPTDGLADQGPTAQDSGPLNLTADPEAPTVAMRPPYAGVDPNQPALDFDNL